MSTEKHPPKFNFWKSWIFKTAIVLVLIYLVILGVVEMMDSNIKGEWKTFDRDNSPFSSYYQRRINAIATDDKQRIWVGTDEGLHMLDSTGAWTSYTSENSPIIVDDVEKLAIDTTGNIWIAAYSGLYVFNPQDNVWGKISGDFSLSGIQSLAVDHDNQTWVGTDHGLYVLNGIDGNQTKLLPDDIYTVAVDRFDRVWIGTERDGILVYDQKREDWITYETNDTGLRSNSIRCFLFDRQDRVWVGTERGGVNVLDANGHWISEIINPEYNKYSVAAMTSDQQGNIWISMSEWDGSILVYLGGAHGSIYTHENSRLPYYAYPITVDASNRLWMGSGGLKMIDLNEGLPKTAPYNWIVTRTVIRRPMEIILYTADEISTYFGYFWYGLVPITVMYTVSGIGIYYGVKKRSKSAMIFSIIFLFITIVLTLFFCNFMMMAMFVQG
jgi:ligand-binding sensor domain-containing protein